MIGAWTSKKSTNQGSPSRSVEGKYTPETVAKKPSLLICSFKFATFNNFNMKNIILIFTAAMALALVSPAQSYGDQEIAEIILESFEDVPPSGDYITTYCHLGILYKVSWFIDHATNLVVTEVSQIGNCGSGGSGMPLDMTHETR